MILPDGEFLFFFTPILINPQFCGLDSNLAIEIKNAEEKAINPDNNILCIFLIMFFILLVKGYRLQCGSTNV
jgi:hypothetical protein